MKNISIIILVVILTATAGYCGTDVSESGELWSYSENPFVFRLDQPVSRLSGGVFVHDVDGDGLFDFVITSDGHIGVYDLHGKKMWVRKVDIKLWDYTHHPSAIAGDIDGDGVAEIAYLSSDKIVIINAVTGADEKSLSFGKVQAMSIANLRGKGDRDAILQYSQTSIKAINLEDGSELWQSDEYRGIEHSPLRTADIDGDGLDEVAGVGIIDHDGKKMNSWDLGNAYRNADSLVIADVIEGYPLEVVIAEQRGSESRTDVVNPEAIIFRCLNPWKWEDPDKVAVGDFDRSRDGLEIFNRSSGGDGTCPRGKGEQFGSEECPWVIDSAGKEISRYYVNDKKPAWWTGHGIEEICRIDWDGDGEDEIVAKERHINGAGAIINPITGQFKEIFEGKAERIYAADIQGDFREEVIMLDDSGVVKVFWNEEVNRGQAKERYWDKQHYRRQKQNWNYYSP